MSGLLAPSRMTSDPRNQKLFARAWSLLWLKWIYVLCFTLLILTLIHLFRERKDIQASGAVMPPEISS